MIYNKGSEILQLKNSNPGVVVGKNSFGSADFEGTIYVDTDNDDDYIGFVFGFQSDQKFYIVMWKKTNQTYREELPFKAIAGNFNKILTKYFIIILKIIRGWSSN